MVVHLTSPNHRYDKLYLANYAQLHVKDALARTYGVGDVQMFGTGAYSMRVWLDPQKLASRGMTAGDIVTALREQNVQVAAGQVGAPPAPGQADFQIAINTQGRLTTEEQFGDVIIRAGAKGEISHLRDWARTAMPCARCWTTRTPSPCRSSSARAPTPCRWPTTCARPWTA
jgi:multidrug efflux pump